MLPPDIRIKIVFAQANAGEQEEEMLEADVSFWQKRLCAIMSKRNFDLTGKRKQSSYFVK